MKVIQPNCRVQFTADDIAFISTALAAKGDAAPSLVSLLTDPDARDLILDDDNLFQALLEQRRCLRVSAHFYFYVLVRHVLRKSGIDDRNVADYVAEMLAQFSSSQRARKPLPNEGHMDYLFEMLTALQSASESNQFLIRAHVGNHSLFVSGVFPEHIRYRAQFRGAPELEYYESVGRSNY